MKRFSLLELTLVVGLSILFPPILLMGFFVVVPRQEMVVLRLAGMPRPSKQKGFTGPILSVGK